MGEDVSQLQKEWRQIVLDKLTSMEKDQHEIRDDLTEIKTTFVRQQAMDELKAANSREMDILRGKIEELNAFKYKLLGMATGLSFLITVIGFYFSRH